MGKSTIRDVAERRGPVTRNDFEAARDCGEDVGRFAALAVNDDLERLAGSPPRVRRNSGRSCSIGSSALTAPTFFHGFASAGWPFIYRSPRA